MKQDTSATIFQAIAYGEIFEVAYFTALIYNITNDIPGYEIGSDAVRGAILDALTVVQAQEELHAIGINGILQSAGRKPMGACEYTFPVSTFDDAIAQIATFTDVLALGGLQDALGAFNSDGDGEVIPLLVSVAAQEASSNLNAELRRSFRVAELIDTRLPGRAKRFLPQSTTESSLSTSLLDPVDRTVRLLIHDAELHRSKFLSSRD